MRDLLIAIIVGGGSLWALRRPWIGAILWTVISLMNPHVQFGYAAAGWPVGSVVAICTLIGTVFYRHKHNPFASPPMWALLALVMWISLTLPFSFYVDASYPLWVRSMKIFLMIFVTVALIDSREKLNVFVWAMVLSLGYTGLKGGVFTLMTGGNFHIWGPGGFVEGNNEIGLALLMTIPLMRYLQLQMNRSWARHAMSAWMLLTAIAVLGTYSRGSLLGVVAMTVFLWLKNRNKVPRAVLFVLIGSIVLPFMPEQWWDRMATIQTYDQDQSALGRLNAWGMAWNLARDKVVFGGGLEIYVAEVFRRYAPDPDLSLAAHSIYFQVMGEQGFGGLFLFLLNGVLAWWVAADSIKRGGRTPEDRWASDLGSMVQVSLVGYAVGGAFLSLAWFDLPYDMMAAAVIGDLILKRKARAQREIEPARASQSQAALSHPTL